MKIGLNKAGLAVCALIALALAPAAALSETKTVAAGTQWVVEKATALTELTIGDGATVTAPVGYSLTLTVNGVETSVAPGSYKGNVVLTPAKDLVIHFDEMNMTSDFKYRQAIYVNDGAYQPEQSVASAVKSGKITDRSADNVSITSNAEKFNGIIVGGNSNYTIDNPTIRLTGNGKNDFAGLGAAIRVGGTSHVTVNHANILNTGAVRGAIWVGDDAEIVVNDSEIETRSGVLPKDYGWSFVKGPDGSGTVMMEVPWMLGIVGNNRATIVTTNGIARYNNTHIKAQAWGAMSTDAIRQGKIYLTKCHVEVIDSGYGSFADGQSEVHSIGTRFDVASYALILSGGSGEFTSGSVVNSRNVGVMAHGGHSGSLIVDKGSVFNTEKAVFQFKSSTPSILVDSATLNSKNGIILQMMVNDDPNKPSGGGGAPQGGAPGAGGPDGPGGAAPAGGAAPMGAGPGGAPPSGGSAPGASGPGGAGGPGGNGNQDLSATFRNVTLKGDFYNSLTSQSAMNLTFEKATVTGAICTAKGEHGIGPHGEKLVMQDSSALYYLIGDEKETCAPTQDAHGATVALQQGSRWTVTKTSYLTGLTIGGDSSITAPAGSTVTMTVDGAEKTLVPGSYEGKIVLQVAAK